MKLKEIKPGMVIHCKTKNEANMLLWELVHLGYRWWNGKSICELHFEDRVNGCGYWIKDNRTVDWGSIGYYRERTAEYGEIVPFSYLIIEEKTYEDGLNKAWEFVHKVSDISYKELSNIFGVSMENPWGELIDKHSASEAISKLEAYEAEKQIKVGDVVVGNIFKGVVTAICNGRAFIMYDDGSSKEISIDKCQKTGKHIDISSILEEIGKE